MTYRKKLIEVALPLEVINQASLRELQNPFVRGHPRGLKWWARLPLSACRAVVWATFIDDPSSRPDLFPTTKLQEQERERLFSLITKAVSDVVPAQETIDALRQELPDHDQLPPVIDPFAGGGTISVEAIRLGLSSYASDLNPIAVLIEHCTVEIPSRFRGREPISESPDTLLESGGLPHSALGLALDVKHYGQWVREKAAQRVGGLYPKASLAESGQVPIDKIDAWIWARTVQCPNPACRASVPLIRSLRLSSRKGKKTYLDPAPSRDGVVFSISDVEGNDRGTVTRNSILCLTCKSTHPLAYVRREGKAGRIGQQLIALVARTSSGRVFLPADEVQVDAADVPIPSSGIPETSLPEQALGFRVQGYGIDTHKRLFTPRQLTTLQVFGDLIREAGEEVEQKAIEAGWRDDGTPLHEGGEGARAYAEAVTLLLGQAFARSVMFNNTLCKWNVTNENIANPFSLQTLSMTWDFVEANPIEGPLAFDVHADLVADIVASMPTIAEPQEISVTQLDARAVAPPQKVVVITDPPYYDNVGYSDLADFFYVWLRVALKDLDPKVFSTLASPKEKELVADAGRHDGDGDAARKEFREGLQEVFASIRQYQHDGYPMSVFYAFKQSEEAGGASRVSTGWEAMLEGLLGSGLMILRTWPLQTVRPARARGQLSNALSSSVLLVCRPRHVEAPMATRSEFEVALRNQLPDEIRSLQSLSIAPVDLAQAAIGPGMAVYSRFSRVVEADGSSMAVRRALMLINEVLQEVLSQEETEFDNDTRWALTWYEEHGFTSGAFGRAELLSKAKDTSVAGLVHAGVATSRDGKVQLVGPDELSDDWDPTVDQRATVWELTHHLIRRLESSESHAAELLRRVGSGYGDRARQLAYLLFDIAERKGRAKEAVAYNSLIQAWPDLTRLAASGSGPVQQTLGE